VLVVDDLPEHDVGFIGVLDPEPFHEIERLPDPDAIAQRLGQDDLQAGFSRQRIKEFGTQYKWRADLS
jgi:hypothetical protein